MLNATNQTAPTIAPAHAHLLAELARIRRVLDVLPLPDDTAAKAHQEISETEVALLEADPDRRRITGCLERLALALAASGALDHAGQALSAPLESLAGWLGDSGQSVRDLVGPR
ncbi:hypothetical protein [Actinoplanes derwentensis]|uniref:Uncharacterized protein n=1 Tax=Actinoplanes derwentensis TaxID=113562 RepID=A0A1H2AU96_9ACTN|nr:hypothetical protein [Actinoplanes derwentensis]GID84302.1 hypothetical protein Ade03nite_32260 [Actinoplanes derwentensis]SDT49625.1 hypothetical protein SAMN04489716_4107 [Actinoplanes derwentensis]